MIKRYREIKEDAYMHFRNLLTKQEDVDIDTTMGMLANIPTSFNQMDNKELEKEIEENDIISTI